VNIKHTLRLIGIALFLTSAARLPAADGYAIVVSKTTHAHADWAPVVEALSSKHDGIVIEYENSLSESLPALQKAFPKYTCIVAKPEDAGRAFVAAAHRLTRQLDADPYPDTIWAIVTGYEPADALRIAKHAEPLAVKRALTGTVGSPLDAYDEGVMFNELKANAMWDKVSGQAVVPKSCPQDTTKLIVDSLNDYKPDVFITSGHATERNWQLGFSYRNGYFKCKNGQLYGQDSSGERHDVNSPNPKIHLPVGNCLIAHVSNRECMALALMHSAGVNQMVGYTIPTGYGYGGWGVKDYFSELQAGRFSLSEAHHANQIALNYNIETLAKAGKRIRGLSGDRDVVVLYGDPAWEARMPKRRLPWTQTLSEKDGIYTFTVTTNERGDWDNRPVIHLLPKRITNVQLFSGEEFNPVIADNFILIKFNKGVAPMKGNRGEAIPIRGDYEKDHTFTITFSGRVI
jgi:zinc protease